MKNHSQVILKGLAYSLLVNAPALIGLYIILSTKGLMKPLTFSLGAFLAGFTGLIIAIRKESPTALGGNKGKSAVLIGSLFTAICWVSSLYILLFGF